MAKQIKAIKCPQCGSSLNSKISEDHYKCNNCGTEYFLDNDDVNININHRFNQPPTDNSKIFKIIGGILLFIVASSIFITTCSRLFKKNTPSSTYGVYSSSNNKEKDEDKKNKFKDSFNYSFVFENNSKDIIVFGISKREYGEAFSKDERDGYYFIFKNLLTGKILEATKLDIKEVKNKDARTFVDGKTYLIINKRTLYVINEANLSVDDITESTFNKHQEFSSGIASLEFVYEPRGNGLQVMSNVGKEYFYYPLVDKVYNGDSAYTARLGFNTLLPGAKNVTYYETTRKSDYFKEEPIQLLRIVYKSNNGGPEEKENNPSWFKDFGRSGVFTDRSPYVKRLFREERNRIVSYTDITPGRLYFSAAVKYFDDKVVIISFRPTAAEDAPRILQCLDANSAEVKWSLNLEEKDAIQDHLIATSHGYIGKAGYNRYILITTDGKIDRELFL